MNKFAKRALIAAAATPALGLAAVTAISRGYYRRSNVASASEIYNRVTQNKSKMADPIEWDNYLLQHAEQNEERYSMPTLMSFKVSVEETHEHDMQVFHLNKRSINDRVVLYIHGRTFVDQPSIYHWMFLDKLARKTRAEIVVPIYPLAPVHTHVEAYAALEALYLNLIEKYGAENITVMGDSAGAGMVAGITLSLKEEGKVLPSQLILISPWVDMSLQNPDVAHYESQDAMFSLLGLKKAAKLWCKGKDIYDYRLSPIEGPVRGFPKTLIICGTREIFYPDARLFYERLKAAEVKCNFIQGTGLHNNYPLYPIPEASSAQEAIYALINEV